MTICLANNAPLADSSEQGILVELVKAMRPYFRGGELNLLISPFARSLSMVAHGMCDVHMPMLKNPAMGLLDPQLALTDDVLFRVQFVLYSHMDTPEQGSAALRNMRIETDLAHTRLFPFPVAGSTCLACSLKKVRYGRIDGVIFAAKEMNLLLRREHITGLRMTPYGQFDVHAVVRSGAAGVAAAQRLHTLLDQLRQSGEYQRIMQPLLDYDWRD